MHKITTIAVASFEKGILNEELSVHDAWTVILLRKLYHLLSSKYKAVCMAVYATVFRDFNKSNLQSTISHNLYHLPHSLQLMEKMCRHSFNAVALLAALGTTLVRS